MPTRRLFEPGCVRLMDGAMGTELLRFFPGTNVEPLEAWNLSHPVRVRRVHEAYHGAGAEVFLTHTFQAHPSLLPRQDLGDVWRAAKKNLAEAIPSGINLADIGPVPAGGTFASELFDQAASCEGLFQETVTTLAEVKAFSAARERAICSTPWLIAFSFRSVGAGRYGLVNEPSADPGVCARLARDLGAVGVGVGCGVDVGPGDWAAIARAFREAAPDLAMFAKTNAGFQHPLAVDVWAAGMANLVREGVTMLGGCCGTSPAYIKALALLLRA